MVLVGVWFRFWLVGGGLLLLRLGVWVLLLFGCVLICCWVWVACFECFTVWCWFGYCCCLGAA